MADRELFLTPPQVRQAQQPLVVTNDRPAYRVLDERGLFADDTLWPAGSVIYFDDEPNEELEPLNEKARDVMRAYIQKLDAYAEDVAKKTGKRFIGRSRNLEDAMNDLREDSRRVSLVQDGKDGGVPIMGAKRRGKPKISKVGAPEVPETGGREPKRSVGSIA